MPKVTYLNSHLQKYREEPEFKIDLEDVEALAYYDILVKEDKKTLKNFQDIYRSTAISNETTIETIKLFYQKYNYFP